MAASLPRKPHGSTALLSRHVHARTLASAIVAAFLARWYHTNPPCLVYNWHCLLRAHPNIRATIRASPAPGVARMLGVRLSSLCISRARGGAERRGESETSWPAPPQIFFDELVGARAPSSPRIGICQQRRRPSGRIIIAFAPIGAGPQSATGSSTTDRKMCSTDSDGGYAVLSLPNFRLPRSWTLSLSAAARRTTV